MNLPSVICSGDAGPSSARLARRLSQARLSLVSCLRCMLKQRQITLPGRRRFTDGTAMAWKSEALCSGWHCDGQSTESWTQLKCCCCQRQIKGLRGNDCRKRSVCVCVCVCVRACVCVCSCNTMKTSFCKIKITTHDPPAARCSHVVNAVVFHPFLLDAL